MDVGVWWLIFLGVAVVVVTGTAGHRVLTVPQIEQHEALEKVGSRHSLTTEPLAAAQQPHLAQPQQQPQGIIPGNSGGIIGSLTPVLRATMTAQAEEKQTAACEVVVIEGWLEKRTKQGFWHSRYFRLTRSHLVYFRRKPKEQEEGSRLVGLASGVEASMHKEVLKWRTRDGNSQGRLRGAAASKWFEALINISKPPVVLAEPPSVVNSTAPLVAVEPGLTSVELGKVAELRAELRSIEAPEWLFGDASLVRFLRARDMDLKKAATMWRLHNEWRSEYGIEAISMRDEDSDPVESFIRDWWPAGALSGPDRQGLPVDMIRLGASDIPGVERAVGRPRFVEFAARRNELLFARLRALSEQRGRTETSASILLDMEGFGRRHFAGVPGFAAMMAMAEPNYPERLGKIFIVRAPWIFPTIYGLIRPLLNEGTRDKVKILSQQDHLRVLLEHMPIESIPVELGGEADSTTDVSKGGLVPAEAFEKLMLLVDGEDAPSRSRKHSR